MNNDLEHRRQEWEQHNSCVEIVFRGISAAVVTLAVSGSLCFLANAAAHKLHCCNTEKQKTLVEAFKPND